jgi:hypothetical protein
MSYGGSLGPENLLTLCNFVIAVEMAVESDWKQQGQNVPRPLILNALTYGRQLKIGIPIHQKNRLHSDKPSDRDFFCRAPAGLICPSL